MYVTQDLPISLGFGQEPGQWGTLGVQGILGPMMGSGHIRTIPATLPNQTWANGTGPLAALTTGHEATGGSLS